MDLPSDSSESKEPVPSERKKTLPSGPAEHKDNNKIKFFRGFFVETVYCLTRIVNLRENGLTSSDPHAFQISIFWGGFEFKCSAPTRPATLLSLAGVYKNKQGLSKDPESQGTLFGI